MVADHHQRQEDWIIDGAGPEDPLLDLDCQLVLGRPPSKQPVTCLYCGKILADKKNHERHVANAHQNSQQRVKCQFCQRTFKNKHSLEHHCRKIHNLTNEAVRNALEHQAAWKKDD